MMKGRTANIYVNPSFHFLWKKKNRFIVLKGGAGSSKSYSVFQYILTLMCSVKGCNVIAARKVANTLRGSVFNLMKQLISNYDMNDDFKINNSDLIIRHKATKNMMICIGMDDREKIKSVTAENGPITTIVMEEGNQFDQDDLDQLNTRLRGKTPIPKQIIIPFNPVSEEHWLKEAFWDKHLYEDALTHESTYRDNLKVDEEYKKQLENYKYTNPYMYDVYCRGKWGSLDDNDVIIPYHKGYAAKYRKEDVEEAGLLCIGLDVARYGDDESVAYAKRGMKVLERRSCSKQDATGVSKMVINLITLLRKGKNDKVRINIDATGVGSGAVDMINLLLNKVPNIEVYEVHFGGTAEEEDVYANCVTEMYYNVGKMIDEMKLLEWDDDLLPELCKRTYKIDSRTSRRVIEKKEDFKKRLNRSPDSADALVLAFYTGKGHNREKKNNYDWLERYM